MTVTAASIEMTVTAHTKTNQERLLAFSSRSLIDLSPVDAESEFPASSVDFLPVLSLVGRPVGVALLDSELNFDRPIWVQFRPADSRAFFHRWQFMDWGP